MTNTVNRSDSMYFHIAASKASEFIGLFQLTLQGLPPPVCPGTLGYKIIKASFLPSHREVTLLNIFIQRSGGGVSL